RSDGEDRRVTAGGVRTPQRRALPEVGRQRDGGQPATRVAVPRSADRDEAGRARPGTPTRVERPASIGAGERARPERGAKVLPVRVQGGEERARSHSATPARAGQVERGSRAPKAEAGRGGGKAGVGGRR